MRKFYAFVSMADCYVEFLGELESFDDAAEIVEDMERDGKYVPFIFTEESLKQFVDSAKTVLG